jgi:hypothetical protein
VGGYKGGSVGSGREWRERVGGVRVGRGWDEDEDGDEDEDEERRGWGKMRVVRRV